MNDIQSLSHSKWRCQYHIVFIVGILFFMLAAIGIAHTIILWLEGEYSDSPGVGGLIVLISIGFAIVGIKFAGKRK